MPDTDLCTHPVGMTSAGQYASVLADLPGDPAALLAQIDETRLSWFPIEFDLLDGPRDQFLVAGQAWQQIRAGKADPPAFGLSLMNETGGWWVAGNLMRDGAALLNTELLPWDVWGAMPKPDDPIGDDLADLFDQLAEATVTP